MINLRRGEMRCEAKKMNICCAAGVCWMTVGKGGYEPHKQQAASTELTLPKLETPQPIVGIALKGNTG